MCYPNPEASDFFGVSAEVRLCATQIPKHQNNLTLGGGDFFYDALTGAGQRGITGRAGLNNVGLLATVYGRVTSSGSYPRLGISWFYADDGSGVDDGTGVKGIYAEAPRSVTPPEEGSFVSATGISSCDLYNGRLVNVLLVRTQEDIVVVTQAAAQGFGALAASSKAKPPPRLLTRQHRCSSFRTQ